MLLYKYEALSDSGEKISGSIFAENYKTAYESIHSRKSCPLKITPISISNKKVSIEDLLIFFLHIDLQLKCKVKINEAIESFLELHGSKILKSSLAAILIDLRNGSSLGEAFEKCDKIFDSVIIGLLKSAERTGKISDIIANILKFLKLQSEWKNNIKRAIAYPVFLACIAIFVLVFSITLLGPQISSLVRNFGANEIPLITQFVIDYLPLIFQCFICFLPFIFFIILLCIVSEKCRFFIMGVVLKIPKIGSLIIKTNFWQLCKILHIALDAKLDFIEAMDIAISAIKIKNIKNELLEVREKIVEGYSISESFSEMKFISASVISAIGIGEESNDLSSSFVHMSNHQYEEIILDIKSLGQFLSVGLTLFTGMIFVLIICGLFFPIYSYVEIAGA